jgi:hypothetical protein
MRGHERSYDLSELVDCATSLNRLAALDLVEGMQGVGKSHKKHKNIWMKLQVEVDGLESEPQTIVDQTVHTSIANNVKVVTVLQEGFSLAQSAATELQMNPSTSARDKVWWNEPWKIEAKGVKFGGWCDIDVTTLGDCVDALPPDVGPSSVPPVQIANIASSSQPATQVDDVNAVVTDGVPDNIIASGDCVAVMSDMFLELNPEELVYGGGPRTIVKPTVSYQDRHMYKSTLVSQLTSNPFQSKDRLTRVKQSLYFNSLVDKPVVREGVETMFMTIGSDCGVFFLEESQMQVRETRSAKEIAKSFKGKGRSTGGKNLKRPRGELVEVHTIPSGSKYVWWVGRVQSIQRKYG